MRRIVSRRFDFADSRAARAFVAVTHGATLVLVAALPVDAGLMGSLALLVVALGARAWKRAVEGPAGMVIRSDGSVVSLERDGRAIEGVLAEGCVAWPRLATIAWHAGSERRRRQVGVPFDALGTEAHRELRVLLRYATSGEEQASPESQRRASISAALSPLGWPARRWR